MSDTKISEFPEKALNSLDAAGTADFVGGYDVVSNNKTNKKFTFATLANWLLTKFKLTIAGSSQTVKSAVDTLNSKISYETITDFDTFIPSSSVAGVLRKYGFSTADGASHAPLTSGNYTFRGYVEGTTNYCTQHFTVEYATAQYDRGRSFVRLRLSGSWSTWLEIRRNGFGWLPNNTNIDNIIQDGVYGLASGNTYTTLPTGHTAGGVLEVFYPGIGGTYAIQRLSTGNTMFIRYRTNSSGTAYTDWVKMPTRGEIDTLNNRFTTVQVQNATTFTVPNNYRGVLFVADSNYAKCGEYIVNCSGSGSVGYKEISSASDLTIDNATANKLTLTPASGSRWCSFQNINNVITT